MEPVSITIRIDEAKFRADLAAAFAESTQRTVGEATEEAREAVRRFEVTRSAEGRCPLCGA